MAYRPSYVYLIQHLAEKRFKIGKSSDPFTRIGILLASNGNNLDLENMRLLKTQTEADAYAVENIFHNTFRHHAIPANQCPGGSHEWFAIEAWPKAIDMAETLGPLIGFSLQDKLHIPEKLSRKTLVNKNPSNDISQVARELVEQHRLIQKLTVTELVKRVKMSRGTYYLFKNGSNIGFYQFLALLEAVGLSEWFLDTMTGKIRAL